MANINYLAIFLAGTAAWLFGAVYYTALSGPWLAAQGKTMEQCKAEAVGKTKLQMYAPFVVAFVSSLIMAWALYGVLVHLKSFTVRTGVISGAIIWFGFVLTTMTVNNAFHGKKAKLTLIDSLHWLGGLLIMGTIVGWMGR